MMFQTYREEVVYRIGLFHDSGQESWFTEESADLRRRTALLLKYVADNGLLYVDDVDIQAAIAYWNGFVRYGRLPERLAFSPMFGTIPERGTDVRDVDLLISRATEASRYMSDMKMFSQLPFPGHGRKGILGWMQWRWSRLVNRNEVRHPTLRDLIGRHFRFTAVRGYGIREYGPEVIIEGRILNRHGQIEVINGAENSDKKCLIDVAEHIPLDDAGPTRRRALAKYWRRKISNYVVVTASGECPIINISGNDLGIWCLVVANYATGIENSGKNIWGVMEFLD
jgi:hypothetical protein